MMRGLADFRQRILSLIHRLRIWCACRSRRGVTTGRMWEKHRRGEPSKPKALTLIEFQEGAFSVQMGCSVFENAPYLLHSYRVDYDSHIRGDSIQYPYADFSCLQTTIHWNFYSQSILSILKMTGLVPSLQQAIITLSSFVQPCMMLPPCRAV